MRAGGHAGAPSAQTSSRRTGISVRIAAPKLWTPTMLCNVTQLLSLLHASCTSSASGLAWSMTSETTERGPDFPRSGQLGEQRSNREDTHHGAHQEARLSKA